MVSRPNSKILGHLTQCIVSNPWSVWELLAAANPVASGRVTLLNDCGSHRHLRTFFTKQKLFLLESWFYKVYIKLNLDHFWPSYDPFKEVCFFNFPGFTDFQRAVTLLLMKIILNFKNGKKAMYKLFLKCFIVFSFNEIVMPKMLCECE